MPRPVDLSTPSAHPSLEVSHRDCDGGVCVVTPAGEIDIATAPLLKSHLVGLLGEDFRQVVIDLSEVRYLDSTGLGVLVAFSRRLPADGVIVLAQPPAPVSRVLEITGLDTTFAVFATVDEALAHVRGDGGAIAQPALSRDASIVVGLAATALPFAESTADELRRWVRILSLQGEAGRALQRVGVTDVDAELSVRPAPGEGVGPDAHADAVTRVTHAAAAIAADREAPNVSTVDLLLAVMMVYGDAFDRELTGHGTSSTELIECLATSGDPAGVS